MEQPSISGAVTVMAKFAGMTINDVAYAEKEPAAKTLLETCKGVTDKKDFAIGSYMGFDMSLRFDSFNKAFTLLLRGSMTYQTELDTDERDDIDIDPDDELEEDYDPMAVSAKSARPSLLEGIRSYSTDRQPPVHGRKTSRYDRQHIPRRSR